MTDDCFIAIALAQEQKTETAKRLWMKGRWKKRDEFKHENLLNELKLSSSNDFRNF